MPPRAVLIRYAAGFISASSRAPIRPRVCSFSGQWIDTKSASRQQFIQRDEPHAQLSGHSWVDERIEGERRSHAEPGQQRERGPRDAAQPDDPHRSIAQFAAHVLRTVVPLSGPDQRCL